ncbi:MAG: methyl-accepting chemotaxis protein [Treponema sp.]|nr:methyl-accepting chemotaxis protein [Treponema sp.]
MSSTYQGKSTQKRRISAKLIVAVFSVVLFLIFSISGSIAFFLSMSRITYANAGFELANSLEIERIKLEASVNSEIAIALKMASSPLIIQHFLNPGDNALQRLAFDEIEGYRQAFESKITFWASDIDKEFYFDEQNHYTIDAEDPDNYWYNMTLHETESFNFNINYNPEIQRTMLWINATVFDSRRTPIGLVGTGIDLTNFTDNIYRNYTAGGELYLFNSYNEITGANDATLIVDKATLDGVLGNIGTEILAAVNTLVSDESKYFRFEGKEIAVIRVPSLDWYITAIISISAADILNSSMTVLFIVMLAGIAVIFIIFYLFISWLIKPLNIIMTTLGKITDDWNLSRRLDIRRSDETGALADFINLTFGKICSLIKKIKTEAENLSNIGNDLAANMNLTAASMSKITVNVSNVKSRILNQSASVTETNSTMEQVIVNINKLNGNIEGQSNNINKASSAIEEMVVNISSVIETIVKNTGNVDSLKEASEIGRTGLNDVASDIQEISRESEGLLEINSVMENIASQTNLLSMNAAIEAAHAGEAGRGFAVVADEIRKLAVSSGEQSKTIGAVLKKIKSSIDKITRSTENVLNKFEAIDSNVKLVSVQEENIRTAMEEQGIGSKQILDGISEVKEITRDVNSGSNEMLQGAEEVINESKNLEKLTHEITLGVNEMATSAEHINMAVHHTNEISNRNRDAINVLIQEVSRFNIE